MFLDKGECLVFFNIYRVAPGDLPGPLTEILLDAQLLQTEFIGIEK